MTKVLQSFYSRESLEELTAKAHEFNASVFIEFQVNRTKCMLPNVGFSKLAVNCLRLKDNNTLDGYLDSVVWGAPVSIIDSCMRTIESDDLNPLALIRRGEAIHSGLIRGVDEWFERPVITEHCWLYDINTVIALSYRMPFRSHDFIAFNYMGLVEELPSVESNLQGLEYINLPFYIAWLYRKGIIDLESLLACMQALEGLSVAEVRILRGLWKPHGLNIQHLAYLLNVKPSTVNKHLEQIVNKKRHMLERYNLDSSMKVPRIPFLMMLYSFLQWA